MTPAGDDGKKPRHGCPPNRRNAITSQAPSQSSPFLALNGQHIPSPGSARQLTGATRGTRQQNNQPRFSGVAQTTVPPLPHPVIVPPSIGSPAPIHQDDYVSSHPRLTDSFQALPSHQRMEPRSLQRLGSLPRLPPGSKIEGTQSNPEAKPETGAISLNPGTRYFRVEIDDFWYTMLQDAKKQTHAEINQKQNRLDRASRRFAYQHGITSQAEPGSTQRA